MAVTATTTRRTSRILEARCSVTSGGGTYTITAAALQPGALRNLLLLGASAPALPPLRVDAVKESTTGGALGKPLFAQTVVGTELQLSFTWDDPGATAESWLARVEYVHSEVR